MKTTSNKKPISSLKKQFPAAGVFKTIRGKLTLSFTLIFGITLIVFSFVLYNVFARQSRNDFDLLMNILASSLSETVKENGVSPDILGEIKEFNSPGLSAYFGYIRIYSSSEVLSLQSPQLNNTDVKLSANLVLSAINGKKEIATIREGAVSGLWDSYGARVLYYPAVHRQHRYAIVLIAPLSSVETMLSNLRLIIFLTIPVTLLLSAGAGWFFSKRAYAPVGELVAKANTITAEKLNQRLAVSDADDEISHLAETLNNMIERLEGSFNTLKQFTSDASHELRTPLTILRGEIEVALKRRRGESEYESILRDNLEEVSRLQNIVEGLLMLSQLENRQIVLQNEKIDLAGLASDAAAKGSILAEKKNIRLIMKLDEDSPGSIFITGDYRKLMNVLLNLFENAVKYSNENTTITCYAGISQNRKFGLVAIKDDGIGISEPDLKNIFERFYRADSSRTRSEGRSLGLGLSISKAVVNAHGGSIEVKSKEGSGSQFTVFLPLSVDQ
jgi:heavy metal sensor kinase